MYTLKKYLYDVAYGVHKPKNRLWIPIALLSGYAGYKLGSF